MEKNITIPTLNIFLSLLSANQKDIKTIKSIKGETKHIEKAIKITSKYETTLRILSNANAPPDESCLFLSANEIIVFLICFDYYFNNQDEIDKNGYIEISLQTLNQYRNIKRASNSIANIYLNAFKKLADKKIIIQFDLEECEKTYIEKFGEYIIAEPLVEFKEIIKNERLVGFKIKFDKLFKLFLISKQTTYMPISFLQIRISEIVKLLIAIFIESYLRINYNKDYKNIKIKTILGNIPFFAEHLSISEKSILEKVDNRDMSSYTVFNRFINKLNEVLKILKQYDNKLVDYNISNVNIKNYRDSNSVITLIMK